MTDSPKPFYCRRAIRRAGAAGLLGVPVIMLFTWILYRVDSSLFSLEQSTPLRWAMWLILAGQWVAGPLRGLWYLLLPDFTKPARQALRLSGTPRRDLEELYREIEADLDRPVPALRGALLGQGWLWGGHRFVPLAAVGTVVLPITASIGPVRLQSPRLTLLDKQRRPCCVLGRKFPIQAAHLEALAKEILERCPPETLFSRRPEDQHRCNPLSRLGADPAPRHPPLPAAPPPVPPAESPAAPMNARPSGLPAAPPAPPAHVSPTTPEPASPTAPRDTQQPQAPHPTAPAPVQAPTATPGESTEEEYTIPSRVLAGALLLVFLISLPVTLSLYSRGSGALFAALPVTLFAGVGMLLSAASSLREKKAPAHPPRPAPTPHPTSPGPPKALPPEAQQDLAHPAFVTGYFIFGSRWLWANGELLPLNAIQQAVLCLPGGQQPAPRYPTLLLYAGRPHPLSFIGDEPMLLAAHDYIGSRHPHIICIRDQAPPPPTPFLR